MLPVPPHPLCVPNPAVVQPCAKLRGCRETSNATPPLAPGGGARRRKADVTAWEGEQEAVGWGGFTPEALPWKRGVCPGNTPVP